ncbi:hypothetical protein DW182_03275 [Bacteroides sp. AM16-24]|uniref:methyl-accepting chemotaxis protein n=1 Tax=Bacteroides sp. AM16-24 TaxID=2292002 RepID=UPI000FF29102|nr:methyl-accepting chemotaxis protein [Bacteroides sp. AM16-24]RHI11534.1 hypothetical protein DW182_03275 [Bacteroides sp. AM16-24]
MIKISPFTPLFFSPSSDKFGAESRYIQLFAPADNIFIEVITTTEYKINGLLKNHVDGTSREIEFQSFSLKDGSTVFHSTITGLASGYYSISVGDQECNVFKVTDDEHELGKTTLIRYSMRSNKQRNDCIFWNGEEQFYFEFRAPGGFKDDDWTFAVNNEQFEISNGNIVELFAVESTQKKFTLGNAEGCPVWFAEHLNRILCCSNVYFNGVRFVRKGNSAPEMTQEIVSLKSYIFKVSLQGMVDNIDVDFPEGGEEEGGETGGGGEGYIYLIKLNDTVVPTDRNTFSSLRLLAEIDKAISANNILFIDTFLRKDQPDSTNHLTGFNAGITIGESKKQLLDIIRLSDLDIHPSDTSVYTALTTDQRIEDELKPLEDKYIRKDQPDSTGYITGFNAGITIGINKKSFLDIIRTTDTDTAPSDTSVYSSLVTDERYISKYQPDSTLYPVDFTAGLSINSKRIGDVIRYYDENKPVATDANIYSALQTDQRIDEEFGKIDDRYIRKDKEDIAHKHITFEDGITVYQLAEMMNVDVKNLATIAKAVVSILRSSKFVDGFSGEGYQIWQDIATGDWNMTLDRLTVRKVLTIYELVLQKIRSVGGMVVVSAANGKVKSVERIGNNYLFTFEDTNQFQPDDFMRCQVFSPSGLKYYWVKVASVSGESVIVPLSEFDGVIPAAGDEVVLMGNATDKRRQSLILISATEDGQPRFDCLDGVKSKNLEGCLKVRVGSLDGISDSRFPADMQPSGYGLYGNNCFLTGIFVLSNGKDVMTMFSIMEGMIKSEISSVRNEINAKDNYLSNASFSGDLMDWSSTNRVRVFRVDNRLLSFNNNFYANKENLASITLEDGRSVLRLKNSSITQYNSNFARYPKFDEKIKYEEVEVPVLDADGNPVLDESGQPVTELQEVPVLDGEGNTVMIKIPRQFYISFNYMVKRTGTLTVYFKNESSDESGNSYKEEFEPYDPIYFVQSLLPTSGFQKMEIAGKWNGKGHFYLAFTGDMYLYSLALADNPLAEMEEKFTMRFEATDKKIQANLDEIKKTGTRLEEYHSEFLLTARNLQTKFTEDLSDAESRITAAYKSYVNLTARDLTVQFQADINNAETRITEAYTSAIELSAKGLQTKFTADLTDMEAGITAAYKSYVNLTAQNLEAGFTEDLTDLRTGVTEAYKAAIDLSARGLRADFNSSIADLNGKLTTHTSSFHVTASKIEAMVTATDNISNTIHTAGWITTADGNKLWATISTVDALGNRLTSHEGKFHVSATEISGIVTRIDATESSISGINKTISSSGWITTADGNKLWSTLTQYNALNQVVSTHTGSFHVTADKINSMVESIDDTGRKYSAITQTVGEIRADVNDVSGKYANLSLKVDAISAVVGDGSTGSFSEFLQTVNEISASVTEVKNGLDTHKGSFHVTADKINAMVSATDSISNTIRTAGWITTADGNKLWSTLTQYNALNQVVSSHTGSFHVTADKIEAMVTATDNISNTIKTAGWITKSDGNTWWASKGTEQTASDAAKSAINAATAAADAMTKANSAYDKADDTATALVQTNSSLSAIAGRFNADGTLKEGAGWVTTADAAALYATKQTVNSLGERVTTAESRITANADSISLTVKKDGIISAINQTAESVTIDASKINLNGKVTISSLAQDVKNSIDSKVSTSSLGSLAYKDAVELAQLGDTIIEGGYLKTNLINVDTLIAKKMHADNGSYTVDVDSYGIRMNDGRTNILDIRAESVSNTTDAIFELHSYGRTGGRLKMSTSMGIYKYDNFDYLQFVLNERGLFFYNESGDITKSYPAY